jgi:DNA-binding LacI/PurR family transcriptional regulator
LLEFIRGVADSLAEQDYNLLLAMPRPSSKPEDDPYRPLHQSSVDGALILETRGTAESLTGQPYPWLTLGYRRADDGSTAHNLIHADDFGGALRLVQHLHSLGHTRIGLISGVLQSMGAVEERVRGYQAALHAAGGPADAALIAYGDFTPESGYRAVDRLLDLPDPPTAVFALNDRMALGAIQRIRERGLRVPEDISVAGFDNIPAAALSMPPLTTVHQPGFEMGVRAATLLGQLIRREIDQFDSEVFPTRLIVRASTAASPGRR